MNWADDTDEAEESTMIELLQRLVAWLRVQLAPRPRLPWYLTPEWQAYEEREWQEKQERLAREIWAKHRAEQQRARTKARRVAAYHRGQARLPALLVHRKAYCRRQHQPPTPLAHRLGPTMVVTAPLTGWGGHPDTWN